MVSCSEYEALLGLFLLRFNQVEEAISAVIRHSLDSVGYGELGEFLCKNTFERRVDLIDILARDNTRLNHSLQGRLKALGRARNEFAHAAIAYHPLAGGVVRLKDFANIDIMRLKTLSEEADELVVLLFGLILEACVMPSIKTSS